MDILPSEIILYVFTFLDPLEIVGLQLVSRRFYRLGRDNSHWRTHCFETSLWEKLRQKGKSVQSPLLRNPRNALNGEPSWRTSDRVDDIHSTKLMADERSRILANWDPSYPGEKISWYSEFIHRTGAISVSWLQQPRNRASTEREPMEVRGAGVYNPPGDEETSISIGPLDDGSICLWDMNSLSNRYGRIIGRSVSDVLFTAGSASGAIRSRMINTGVTECVSVDSYHKRVYIAVQSELIGIDLETLKAVSQERFPFSISAISEARQATPITVGTNLSLHMYDPRMGHSHLTSSEVPEQLDQLAPLPAAYPYQSHYNIQPTNYAPLFRPGPLCISHLPTSGENWDSNGDIYVAGRFSNILRYDRRSFPKLHSTIYSGARLCSMTSIPYPFAGQLRDPTCRGEMSTEQVEAAKQLPGSTLVACGEYNSKGSLELYSLSPHSQPLDLVANSFDGKAHVFEPLKNRQSSSTSKLLSVSTHGTRIVYSDGGGNMKWVERDGYTKVRDWNIGFASVEGPRGIFGTEGDSYIESGAGDIVRKILHTKPDVRHCQTPVENDKLVLWTGEKLGLLSFSNTPGFNADDFEAKAKNAEEIAMEHEERTYNQTMRRELQRQADEVRFITGLGLRPM